MGAEPSATDRAAAIALFKEARALMAAGSHEQACAKFAESLRLAPGVGTRFNLAACQAKTGKLASAWANYLEVAAVTGQAGQTKRERAARQQAAALEPMLSTLRIDVRKPVSGLTVTRNEQQVPAAQWNVALPVDPGSYRIHVEAPAHWAHNYEAVVDGKGQTVRVVIQPLKPRQESTSRDEGSAASSVELSDSQASADARATAGWILGGIGLVQAVAGAIMLGVGTSWISEAEENCPDRQNCPSDAEGTDYAALGNDGRTLSAFGEISLGPAAGAVVAGIILIATGQAGDDDAQPAQSRTWIAPQFDSHGSSLTVGAVW